MCGGRPSAPAPAPPPPPNTGPVATPVVEGTTAALGATNRAGGTTSAAGTLGDPNTKAATSKTLLGQ